MDNVIRIIFNGFTLLGIAIISWFIFMVILYIGLELGDFLIETWGNYDK